MTIPEPSLDDPRIPAIVADLRERILAHYPDATFEVARGDDPIGIYVMATVDVEETGEVLDSIMDRLLEVQVDEYLPVYVIPIRPLQAIGEAARPSLTGAAAVAVHAAS